MEESLPASALQIPIRTLKGEAVIDRPHHEAGPRRTRSGHLRPEINHLAVIGVRHPAVEYQETAKVAQIDNLDQQYVRQGVEQSNLRGVARQAGAEMPSRRNGLQPAAPLHGHFGILADKLARLKKK